MKKYILILFALLQWQISFGQTSPFEIVLEPVNVNGLIGLQSYAFGQHENYWLIVGGRLDGLHRRQPFAAFDIPGHNNSILVVDPVNKQTWTASLNSLPTGIKEQLGSTNMEFIQEGNYLYCIGGYGYSASTGDHTTYSNLTAIDIPGVINAVKNNSSITAYFRQISDTKFQVCGGRLRKIEDTYYLLGVQKFIGRYNPMGPSHGPGFVQEYTNSIRKFTIVDDGNTISINHLSPHVDSVNLHRRDYNAEPQILPNGKQGITMFSGVFRPDVDLPYLNCVNIDSSGYTVNNSFQQYYNHYHCAVIPLYSDRNNEMHTVFFGGIAQYYNDNGTKIKDDNVPFVKTIARVTRDLNGTMTEHLMPIEMPSLLGASAEFIPNKNLNHYSNEVIKLDDINKDSTLLGYIYGGINSSAPNIFFINTGTQSEAANTIFKVLLTNSDPLGDDEISLNTTIQNLNVYPNPSSGAYTVSFYSSRKCDAKLLLKDITGKVVIKLDSNQMVKGWNSMNIIMPEDSEPGIYLLTVQTPQGNSTKKIIVEK